MTAWKKHTLRQHLRDEHGVTMTDAEYRKATLDEMACLHHYQVGCSASGPPPLADEEPQPMVAPPTSRAAR